MRSCVRCKCMYESRDMMGALCPFCTQQLRPTPAQEEKEMVAEFQTCPRCNGSKQWSGDVAKGVFETSNEQCSDCDESDRATKTDRDAIWERAYFAALTGTCMNPQITSYTAAVTEASRVADETVARWDEMRGEK